MKKVDDFKKDKTNLVAVSFLYSVLSSPSVFNVMPYLLNESIEVPGSENNFVLIFGIVFSMVVFMTSYYLVKMPGNTVS